MVARKKSVRFGLFSALGVILFAIVGFLAAQEAVPVPRAEITGVDPSKLPEVIVSVNVYDTLGQPVTDLTAADFSVLDPLADAARVVSVDNITNDNLPFSTVLVIDVSSSMFDFPIARAKQAARAFVDGIRPIDSVAIMTFGNTIELIQPFTTDKNTLYAAIDSIVAFGQTALYQGTYDAIGIASTAPTERRAVIVLSDGAEFGGVSRVRRNDAQTLAVTTGVPVYTIGVGYGFDRTYLQSLSAATNARFYESPTLVELTDIFGNLARLLSSQYVVTLAVEVPADGTEYPLALRVTTPEGDAITPAGTLRAPIPIPLVDVGAPPAAPITAPTIFTANVRADQAITTVMFGIVDATGAALEVGQADEAPYTFAVDPVTLQPGDYTLRVMATDADGDIGSGEIALTIGALPSVVTFDPDPRDLDALTEPVRIAVNVSGQTAPVDVRVSVNGITLYGSTELITLDPRRLPPGETDFAVTVTNAGGVTNTTRVPVQVAALPPLIFLEGLSAGQVIETPTSFRFRTDSQTPISRLDMTLNDVPLMMNADGVTYTIDPKAFRPGAATLVIDLADQDTANRVEIPLEIAVLPPTIIVDTLTAGETLTSNRVINLTFDSQTPVIHVAAFVDGVDLAHLVQAPFSVRIDVLRIPPGAHVLRLIADNSGGGTASLDIPFNISPAPAATATATALQATATAAQATQFAAATAQQATVFAQATAQQATVFAQRTQVQSTANAVSTAAQATQFGQATAVAAQATAAQATVFAQRTQVQSTANAVSTAAQATQFAQATAVAAQATAAQATAFAQRTQVQSTANAVSTAAQATQFAGATAIAAEATAARATVFAERTQAIATADAIATAQQASVFAQATAVIVEVTAQQATQFAQETTIAAQATAAQATLDASATRQAAATATAAQATVAARRTAQQATIIVQVTGTSLAQTRTQVSAEVRATATSAQATLETVRTESASTRAAQRAINATATSIPLTETQAVLDAAAATLTAQFIPSETPTPTITPSETLTPSATPTWTLTPSETPSPTLAPSETPTATPDIPATQTAEAVAALLTQTQDARGTQIANATGTRAAGTQAARDAQGTRQADIMNTSSAATRAVLATNAAQAQAAARATQDARAVRAAATQTADSQTQIAATDFAAATLTETARPTETPTETPTLTQTPTPTDDIPASETAVSAATGTAISFAETRIAQATNVQATADQAAALQATADQATAAQIAAVTATANERATQDAERAGTQAARSTQNAQATLDMAAAALGTITVPPTTRPSRTPSPTDDATPEQTPDGGAAGSGEESQTPTPPPTLTPVGTLTLVEVETPPPASDFAPMAVSIIVVILLLLIVFLLARRRVGRS
jgi:VWFA-related protein